MVACANCGAENRPDAEHCLECGVELSASAVDADPWHGRTIAQRYQIIAKLGDGGMGEVYEAIQEPIGRRVALKILNDEMAENPNQVERFRREAQSASQLSNPHTIVVHDFGQDDDGTLFIAMELLEGEMLADRLGRVGRLPLPDIVVILEQVAGSLDEAHEKGVVHRDLKPENIFLTRRGHADIFAKVLDFGIAKLNYDFDGQTVERLTRQGNICGTPHYMAPEQIRDTTVDWRTDVYALGVLLYRFLAGFEPFDANKVIDLLTMHLNEVPPPIQFVVPHAGPSYLALEAVALKALSKEPDKRYQSAGEMAAAARACLIEHEQVQRPVSPTASTVPDPAMPALPIQPRGRTRLWAGVAAIFSVLLAGMWIVQSPGQSPPTAPTAAVQDASKRGLAATENTDETKTGLPPQIVEKKPAPVPATVTTDRERRLIQLRAEVDQQLDEARRKAAEARAKAARAAEMVDRINREIEALSGQLGGAKKAERPETGRIRIRSSANDVVVTIGTRNLGTTPLSDALVLPAGTHTIQARRGATTKRIVVQVTAGQEGTVHLDF
ncbi:MAG: protein kinase [Myxococcota bacterium]|nr:protein kinase [Myxococcota bacterium]